MHSTHSSTSHAPLTLHRFMLLFSFSIVILYALATLSAPGQTVFAAGTISGAVFSDYDSDGVKDATEPGIAGIVVTAYDKAGAARGNATSSSSGAYSISATGTGPYRVEFTIPSSLSYFQPGARSTDSVNGGTSSNSGSTVQFVPDGSTSNVNLALIDPSDYSVANPKLITTAQDSVNPSGHTSLTNDFALLSVDYTVTNSTDATPLVAVSDIGSTWGLAHKRTTNTVYIGAFLKRHTGLGPHGLDGVYVFDANANTYSGGFDLNGITATNGGTINVGSITRSNISGTLTAGSGGDNQLTSTDNVATVDLDAFAKIGKVGYGDIEMAEDDNTLWLVNLNDRTLIAVDTSQISTLTTTDNNNAPAAAVKQYRISSASGASGAPLMTGAPTCTNGNLRPFGLKFYHGKGYLGVVCDASSQSTVQKPVDLDAYVLSFSPTAPSAFTQEVKIDMDYTREYAYQSSNTAGNQLSANWQRWHDTWDTDINVFNTLNFVSFPQPILSGIDFTDNGSMLVGFMDRGAAQGGNNEYAATSGACCSGTQYRMLSVGDMLRVPWTGSAWGTPEAGDTDPGNVPDAAAVTDLSSVDSSGNAGEFFWGDYFPRSTAAIHGETFEGGIVVAPGTGQVVSTSYDPTANETWAQGLIYSEADTSAIADKRYTLFCTGSTGFNPCSSPSANLQNRFGKGSGLGDLELLNTSAPLEIGNRVWRDDNGNGIQDPDEMALDGVTVQLLRAGSVVGTAVTDTNGEYYFVTNTAGDSNTSDNIGQVNDGGTGIRRSTAYVVRVDPSVGSNTNLLNGLALTTANAPDTGAGDGGANQDARDSDATTVSGKYEVSLTTGTAGNNNHTFDIGFAPLGSIGNRVWIDEDSNGYQDEGEDGLANVTVELFNSAGTSLGTRVTDSNGNYLFTGLAAGTYFVHINSGIPSGMTQTTVYPNSGADLYNQDQTTGTNDYGYQVVLGAGQDNLSADFGYNWNPTSDVNTGGATNATAALGDRVWYDTNGNGRQDQGEVGISGVTVTLINPGADLLFGSGDDTTSTTTTNSTGYYIFDGLTPGAYQVQIGSTGNTGAGQPLNGLTQTGDPDHWGTTGTNDNITTTAVVLGPGDVFLDADFGYNGGSVGSIGDFVWLDRDADGIGPNGNGNAGNDNTEVGIAGVTVALIRDTNNNGVWDSGEPIIATSVTSDGTMDVDGDGTVDSTVGFYRFRGLPVTDGTGTDDYIVWVNDTARKLDGLTATYDQNGGSTPATGLVTGYNISRVADLTTTAVTNQDFGYTPDNSGTQASRTTLSTTNTGAIGDRVWLDIDSGDDQDANEPGIPGVRVYLYQDSNGNGTLDTGEPLIASTYTGPDGYYLFPNLVDTDGTGTDDYIVQVDTSTLPGGLAQTYDLNGSQTDGTSAATNLAGTVLTHDFGYVGTGSIGNLVWNDVNANGTLDAGENGISGVTLDLYYDANANGKIDAGEIKLGTATTNASGAYLFSGLPTNDGGNDAAYLVDVTDTAGVLVGYWHSLGANPNTTTDTTGGESTAISHNDPVPVTLTTTVTNNRNADFGYYVQPAAIGNLVWTDTNGNGVQDSGETGIDGVVMQLTITYPGANGVVGTGGDDTVTTIRTTTGDNPNQAGTQHGWYSFDNLLQDEDYNGLNSAGLGEPTFTVSVVTADNTGVLAGLVKTSINQGSGGSQDLLDSDDHGGVSATATEGQRTVDQQTLGSSEGTLASYDFGYTTPVNLGNRIWYDVDNDGVYEPNGNDGNAGTTADNEVGINNVTVNLYRDTDGSGTYNAGDTLVGTTTTNSSGIYSFTLLTPSIASSNSTKYLVVLPDTNFTSGGTLVGYQNSSLTDTANADVDSRDHGIVSGTLGNTNGVVTTNGAVTLTIAGEPDTAVDTDGTSGNLTIDFGFYHLQLSGTIFTDTTTANGTLDAGETSNAILTGITVKLYQDANDDDVADGAAIATTTTTAGGNYSFTNIPAGRYLVGVTQPSGWHSTIDTADQSDSDDPVKGTNNNDNGHGTGYGEVFSRSLDLQAGSTASNNAVTVSTATTSNDRLDFGLSQSPTALEMGKVSTQANDDNTVTVTWDTLSEISAMGFNVQRSDTKNGEFVSVNTDLIPALNPGTLTGSEYTYTDTSVSTGNAYYYRVQLVHGDSTTVETDPVKIVVGTVCKGKTAAPVLIAPTDSAKLDAGKIEFSWNAVDCAKRYHIEIREGSGDGPVIADKNVKGTTFSIKKLKKGTVYYWRVQSCNAKGKCVVGDWVSFKIKKSSK